MSFSHFFIKRPVFASVISLIILLGGIVSYTLLPVDLFPNVGTPTITVSAYYTGANAETIANTVAVPIEKQINGVERMLFMSSSCTSDGSMSLTITFQAGTDPNIAAMLVQNRLNAVLPALPGAVREAGVTVSKASPTMLTLLSFYNPQDLEDYKQGKKLSREETKKRTLYLANFVKINVQDQLIRTEGVGNVVVFNAMDFSMRIWLNPELMAARKVTVSETLLALRTQNIDVASGRIGSPPVPVNAAFNVPLIVQGQFTETEQFENIVLRTDQNDNTILRLKDIAVIELGSMSYQTDSTYNGIPAISAAVYQMSGSNALKVTKNVENILKNMNEKQGLFGKEITYNIAFSASDFINISLNELKRTLIECVVIVIVIVFLFLQSWRAALIPIITIPVSLIGCFFIMWTLGFTINILTLFGLILAIGIVVDDSIVVIENTQRIIDEEGLSSYEAARKAMTEVTGPVIATTLVLMAIFIPTSMATGMTGGIYRQLALTISGSVGISTICALTLAPALAAILLRKSIEKKKRNFLFRWFNYFFDGYSNFYNRTIHWFIAHKITVLFFWFLLLGLVLAAFKVLPSGFIPSEDQGMLFCVIQLPDGATLERTREVVEEIQAIFEADKAGIKNITFVEGVSLFDGTATNAAFGIITLEPWDKRYQTRLERFLLLFGIKPKEGRPQNNELTLFPMFLKWYPKMLGFMDAKVLVIPPPAPGASGTVGGIEFQLLDRNGKGQDELYKTTQDICKQLQETGLFAGVNSTFSPYSPRYVLDIDREKLMKLGASMNELATTLTGYYGSVYVNNFTKFNNNFSVYMQAIGDYRTNPNNVLDAQFRHPNGSMIPIRSVAEIRETVGPQLLKRYQLFPSATIQGQLQYKVPSGKGMEAIEQVMKSYPNYSFMWSGVTYHAAAAGNTTTILLVLCLVFAFLVLCAQYESWTTPIVILMAVPLGIAGALTASTLLMIGINIYTQIGFILMVGLSAKNAILITEFAVEQYHNGRSGVDAAVYAGRKRLRPIMMTSFAFILGVVPLVLATGAGAVCRNAIGTPVFGGMLMETLVGVYVTPVLVVLWTSCFPQKNNSNIKKS
ncbi:MAG: efflux RND transporter permease subunit [Planctomycetaceae bacterium]|jgi:HAE1 family hydrophobic/amphiphilic exporter-1|nr:efflux RND transporter permease subunit [Planctomycetaceae bacterium]